MPYRNVSEAEERNPGIRSLPPKAKRAWVSAFNSAKEQGHDDEVAAKIAWAAARRVMEKMEATFVIDGENIAIGIPFEKVDIKNRTIEGFATLDNVDSAGEIVDFEASREAFRNWIGNIREMHGPKAVGKALKVEEREKVHGNKHYRGIWVKAYISKGAQDTWEKILDGTLRGFSIGGRVLEKRPEIVKSDDDVFSKQHAVRITKYVLSELSVVDNPANPLAVFTGVSPGISIIKMADGDVQVSDVLGVEERHIFYCPLCDVAKTTHDIDNYGCPTCDSNMQHIATSYEDVDAEEIRKMIKAAKLDKDSVAYRPADGGDSCAICKHYTQDGYCELVAGDISPNYVCDRFDSKMKEVEDIKTEEVYNNVVRKSEDDDDIVKREFSDKERRRLAEEGLAMPDGSYPIVTVEDLRNAIRAYGRAKDKEAVKRWIIRRARALGRTDLLPDEWREEMNKTDLHVNQTSDMTNVIDYLVNAIAEKLMKADISGGDIGNVDKESLSRILDILKTAVGNVEEILSKAGVTVLSSEKSTEVDHVEDVTLPAAESADNASPGKVETDGTGSGQTVFAETPGPENVLPQVTKSEDEVALVKSVITEEMTKLSTKLSETLDAINQKFDSLSERVDKIEAGSASRKSADLNVSEELKKSKESFWGGRFFPSEM